MSKILMALATLLFAVALLAAPAPKQPATGLQELGDLLVGRWTSDVT